MLYEFVSQRKVVAKFTRALRMIRWMNRHFEVRGTILLIRHPCAVIRSMLQHRGGWNESHLENLGDSTVDRVFGRNLPTSVRHRFADAVSAADWREEVLAHLWALDYHMAFFGGEDSIHPWVLVPYERLLTQKTDELKRIVEALGVDLTEAARRRLGVASSSASPDVETAEVEQQLTKWQDDLTDEQVKRILSIMPIKG